MGQTLRVNNWLDSKIPPLLGVAYVLILVLGVPPGLALSTLAALLISAAALAGYAHVLNDIFDVTVDRQAGKRNQMAHLPVARRAALVIGLALLGALPWLAVSLTPTALALLVLIYVLPLAYAVPPVRLKERGVWGAVADAALVHALPVLFVIALFARPASDFGSTGLGMLLLAAGWAFCLGLRGIILHQIWDSAGDARAGVRTLVVNAGPERARRYVQRYVFPLEVLAFSLLALLLAPSAPLLVAALVLVVGLSLARLTFEWAPRFDPAPITPGQDIPLHDIYEVWLPVTAAALLAASDVWFATLLIAHLGVFHTSLEVRVRAALVVVWHLPGQLRSGLGSLAHAVRQGASK